MAAVCTCMALGFKVLNRYHECNMGAWAHERDTYLLLLCNHVSGNRLADNRWCELHAAAGNTYHWRPV